MPTKNTESMCMQMRRPCTKSGKEHYMVTTYMYTSSYTMWCFLDNFFHDNTKYNADFELSHHYQLQPLNCCSCKFEVSSKTSITGQPLLSSDGTLIIGLYFTEDYIAVWRSDTDVRISSSRGLTFFHLLRS